MKYKICKNLKSYIKILKCTCKERLKKLEQDSYKMVKNICPFIRESVLLVDSNWTLSITNLFLFLMS